MKTLIFTVSMVSLIVLQSCTGQKPAPLKNSTLNNQAIKESCSDVSFEDQVLSRKNILNIFDCSGWAKAYPVLTDAIKNSNQEQVDDVLAVFNQEMFSTVEKRKSAFAFTVEADKAGELDGLSSFLNKALVEHRLLFQLDLLLRSQKVEGAERTAFLKVLSKDNSVNLRYLKSFQSIALAFEKHKTELLNVLETESDEDMRRRLVIFMDDLAKILTTEEWSHVSKIFFDKESSLKNWATEGLYGDKKNLLHIIENKNFLKDINFFKTSVDEGIKCENTSSEKDFYINIKQETKHKIEILKTGTKDEFEKAMLHGFNKFVAFQAFCQEEKKQQGLSAFSSVIDYVFNILPVSHDYKFIKNIHVIFGEDRYAILRFLTSKNFAQWRDLFIRLGDQDEELVRVLYSILADIPDEDFETMASLIGQLSQNDGQATAWYRSWAKIWGGLNPQEKLDFVNFITIISDKEISLEPNFSLLVNLLETFPDLSSKIAGKLDSDEYQQNVRYLVARLSDPKVQNELSQFLSNKGLFEFFKIMSSSSTTPARKKVLRESVSAVNSYVLSPQEVKETKTRQCYDILSAEYKKNSSYYSLVNNLPEVCLNTLGEVGFVGQIYLWMNTSQKYFEKKFGVDDFHTEAGVWAPSMLHFIFTAAIRLDQNVVSSDGTKGLKLNLDDIYGTLTDRGLLEALHLISNNYEYVSKRVSFESRLQNYLEEQTNENLRNWSSSFFTLLKSEPNSYPINFRPISCKTLSGDLGVNPCLSKDEVTNKILDIIRISKRRNDDGKTLIQEVVRWLHPKGGISLPFLKKEKFKHHASIDEIVRFMYDLSSEKTVKDFNYNTSTTKSLVKGSTLDRLEIVMRDVAFSNNFYGAYFKNTMASADDYREEVLSSRKLLTLLQKVSGPIRTFGNLDRSSKWRIRNVKETYSSLVEISDQYVQQDGSVRSYADFIQGLLTAIGTSSKKSTQDFSPVRIPNDRLPEGHNGIVLTKLVEISGLRHIANYLRSHVSDLSVLDTKEFKQIDSNLISRFDLSSLQENVQRILDSYFDNDRNQLNTIIADVITYASQLNPEDQKNVEEIVVKFLILMSDSEISSQNIEKLASSIETMVKMWPEIREMLLSVENPSELLKLVNKMLDSLVKNPKDVNNLIEMLINSNAISLTEMEDLIKQKDFRKNLLMLLNHLAQMKAPKTNLNWVEAFRSVFASQDFKWGPILTWLDKSMDKKPEHKLTISLLLQVLGDKEGGEYRFKLIMDEFLLNHRPELVQFLTETFPALEIKTE